MFPYENIVAGVAILIVGFVFHFLGQLVSVINWDRATRLGLQEKHMLPEYRVYEHAIAVADVMLGWVYGIAGVGLILGATWGYKLAAIPGAILVYHGISAWFWERNRRTAGHPLFTERFRVVWCGANVAAGLLALLVAWNAV
jgi:hypothetical protein